MVRGTVRALVVAYQFSIDKSAGEAGCFAILRVRRSVVVGGWCLCPLVNLLLTIILKLFTCIRIGLAVKSCDCYWNYNLWQWYCNLFAILIHPPLRTAPRIPVHTWPIHEAERVGLGVAAQGRIVVPVPVVMQALFERRFGCPLRIRAASGYHWPFCRRRASDMKRVPRVAVPEIECVLLVVALRCRFAPREGGRDDRSAGADATPPALTLVAQP